MRQVQYQREKAFNRGEFPIDIRSSQGRFSETYDPYYHSELEFHLVRQGKGQHFIDGMSYSWGKNSIVIIHKNEVHSFIPDPESTVTRIYLMFAAHLVKNRKMSSDALSRLKTLHHIVLSEKQATIVEFLLHQIDEEYRLKNLHWEDIIVDYIDVFLGILYRAADQQPSSQKNEDPLIQEVIKYLDERFAQRPSLEDVANEFYLSPFTLSRKFKQYVGLGFREYLIHKRIVEARKLLEETDMKVLSIMYEVGFETVSTFNRDFRMLTGFSPADYRKLTRTQSK